MKRFYFLSTILLGFLLIGSQLSLKAQDPPEIILIQPNVANIVWTIDESYLISWTDNFSTTVDIYYAVGNGSTTWISLATNVTGSTWTWNTATNPGGLTASAYYKVKIVSTVSGGSVFKISANYFEFTANPTGGTYVDLIQPDIAGLQWESGTSHLLSWMDDIIEDVTFELWYDNGASWVEYTAQSSGLPTSASATTATWTIPPAGSGVGQLAVGNYKIRVESTNDNTIFDLSTNSFEITETPAGGTYIDLIQPDLSGLVWESGTTHVISWMDDLLEDVKLELWYYNGSAWVEYTTIASGLSTSASGTTSFWSIPANLPNNNYKIRAESTSDNTIFDLSANSFEITDTPTGGTYVNLVQPDVAGLQWINGNDYLLSWMDDIFEDLKLILYYYDGASWVPYTAQASGLPTSASGTTSTWTVPPAGNAAGQLAAGNYKIRIESTNDNTLFDISTNSFEIAASPTGGTYINVIQPNVTGITWRYGETHLISWMDDVFENVKLELYKSDGVTLIPAADAGLTSATSVVGTTWSWTIPASSGALVNGTYKFKISSLSSGIVDFSDNAFTLTNIPPTGEIVVIQPNGAENWIHGGSYLISWNDNISENVKVEVTADYTAGSVVWEELTPVGGVTGTTWTWNTQTNWPASFGTTYTGSLYKIRVSTVSGTSLTAPDLSDAAFNFVTTVGGNVYMIQPDGGEVWVDDNVYLISWNDELVENVFIKLYKNGVLVPNTISDLPPYGSSDPGIVGTTYSWHIPETGTVSGVDLLAGTDYKIRVESIYGSSYFDLSAANFEIADYAQGGTTVEVLQPNGGEKLLAGDPYLISWNDDVTENVFIQLYKNNVLIPAASSGLPGYGASDPGVVGSTYNWLVPGGITLGTDYKIRVFSIYTSSLEDYSDSNFEITDELTGGTFVEVLQPNGGEVIQRGVPYLISWNDDVLENVFIQLYKNNVLVTAANSGLPPYGASDPGVVGTTYNWLVPSGITLGADYKIRVFSVYTSSLEDYSDNVFEIVNELTGGTFIDIIQPNGGESWMNTTTHLISWNDDVIENVDIQLDVYNSSNVFQDNYAVATNVVGTTHSWTIDNTLIGLTNGTVGFTVPDSYFKIHIFSTGNPSGISDYSNAYFDIIAFSKSPNSGFDFGVNNTDLVVYPNPTSTEFTVASVDIINRIEVRNILGQLLFANDVDAVQTVIDVNSYDTGMYIVNITVKGEVITKKLFVQ